MSASETDMSGCTAARAALCHIKHTFWSGPARRACCWRCSSSASDSPRIKREMHAAPRNCYTHRSQCGPDSSCCLHARDAPSVSNDAESKRSGTNTCEFVKLLNNCGGPAERCSISGPDDGARMTCCTLSRVALQKACAVSAVVASSHCVVPKRSAASIHKPTSTVCSAVALVCTPHT